MGRACAELFLIKTETMRTEENSKPASEVEEEGKKVSGGSGETDESAETQKAGTSNTNWGNDEMPDESNKKDNMSGYNELPEQEKVGGG